MDKALKHEAVGEALKHNAIDEALKHKAVDEALEHGTAEEALKPLTMPVNMDWELMGAAVARATL